MRGSQNSARLLFAGLLGTNDEQVRTGLKKPEVVG